MMINMQKIDLETWKVIHPRMSKWHPAFFVDFNPEGSKKEPPYTWTACRALVFERDGSACRVCGADNSKEHDLNTKIRFRGNCEVQHIIPKKDGGSDHPENLITLCRRCHLRTFKGGYGGIPSIAPKGQTILGNDV